MSDDLSIPSPTYRVPRHRRGMDPLTKRLAVIACGLGATVFVVVGGWSMQSQKQTSFRRSLHGCCAWVRNPVPLP